MVIEESKEEKKEEVGRAVLSSGKEVVLMSREICSMRRRAAGQWSGGRRYAGRERMTRTTRTTQDGRRV